MILTIKRDTFNPGFTLGEFLVDGAFFGFTCEDADRKLEDGGIKEHGRTAIPRGRYKVTLSMSTRFKKLMVEVIGVRGFSGVRVHGGNTAADTLGCPLLGAIRTAAGVRDCAAINQRLIDLVQGAINRKEPVFLDVI
jgi:hypothetical protein